MRLLIMGPPGSGKGTQAAIRAQHRVAIDEMNAKRTVNGRTLWSIRQPWQGRFKKLSEDPAFQQIQIRYVRDLLARMTLEEKLAQLVGYWVDQRPVVAGDDDAGNVAPMQAEMLAGDVAPLQGEMAATLSTSFEEASRPGIGHLTRVYGTRPVDPIERAEWLWQQQRRLRSQTRLGIPALVHEECLTGLAAWQAATFPTPLAWGASFDPDLVHEMGAVIGSSMRALGIHQGLAPVSDGIRDPPWGRVDEGIAEPP